MIKLDLTINEVNAILLALAKLPYETVAPLITKVREQSLPQVPDAERNEAKRSKLQDDLLKTVANTDVFDAEE